MLRTTALLAALYADWSAGQQQETPIGPVDPDYAYASAEAVERWHDQKVRARRRFHHAEASAEPTDQALPLTTVQAALTRPTL